MAIVEQECITQVENELKVLGFDLEKAPSTKKFVETLVKAVLQEVKKGQVTVNPLGLVAPANGGAVTGSASGTIS